MNAVSVSVVIPSYNSAHLLPDAVRSVLTQSTVPGEIIVVDDGSTDDTQERLAPYAEQVKYIRQDNQGVSTARNRGIEEARGTVIAFLDADDIWHPLKNELQLRALERSPELGLVGSWSFDWPAKSVPPVEQERAGRVTPVSWAELVVRNRLCTSSIMVRRDILARAGWFDPTLQGPEDRDLWLRIAEIAPIANLELPLVGYRNVVGSVSKQAARCQAGMLRILQKLDERGAWGRRWLLRRKAYSYVYHSCCYLHGAAGDQGRALLNALRSFLWYPLPYGRGDVQTPAERPKRLLVTLLRWLGLKRPDRPGTAVPEAARPLLCGDANCP
jgi:glycosyltransferase involved in cell wall biosynthesis